MRALLLLAVCVVAASAANECPWAPLGRCPPGRRRRGGEYGRQWAGRPAPGRDAARRRAALARAGCPLNTAPCARRRAGTRVGCCAVGREPGKQPRPCTPAPRSSAHRLHRSRLPPQLPPQPPTTGQYPHEGPPRTPRRPCRLLHPRALVCLGRDPALGAGRLPRREHVQRAHRGASPCSNAQVHGC